VNAINPRSENENINDKLDRACALLEQTTDTLAKVLKAFKSVQASLYALAEEARRRRE
jgi:hypothetical protein